MLDTSCPDPRHCQFLGFMSSSQTLPAHNHTWPHPKGTTHFSGQAAGRHPSIRPAHAATPYTLKHHRKHLRNKQLANLLIWHAQGSRGKQMLCPKAAWTAKPQVLRHTYFNTDMCHTCYGPTILRTTKHTHTQLTTTLPTTHSSGLHGPSQTSHSTDCRSALTRHVKCIHSHTTAHEPLSTLENSTADKHGTAALLNY